ncbi:hypothetical protein F5Y15DRAFT_403057 [Xylariaceae sp. FL0016]|nr:hypothetical protein F5Y15DRAFT_403057 [Xylariaceae sp. FL0016]
MLHSISFAKKHLIIKYFIRGHAVVICWSLLVALSQGPTSLPVNHGKPSIPGYLHVHDALTVNEGIFSSPSY